MNIKKIFMVFSLILLACALFTLPAGGIMTMAIDDGSIAGEYVLDEIIVKFKDEALFTTSEKQQRRNTINGYKKLSRTDEKTDAYVIKQDMRGRPKDILANYNKNKFVEYAEPNYIAHFNFIPNDPNYKTYQSAALTALNAQSGWDIVTGGGPIVAVVDSGVVSHPDLPALVANHAVVGGTSSEGTTTSSSLTPTSSHGTNVAGVIGMIGNNGIGGAGMNWNAKIMSVKADDANGVLTVANCSKGLIWAADNGAKIINISWGVSTDSVTLKNAINYVYNKGCAMFASTGNGGTSSMGYPARYNNVMAVGSTSNGTTRTASSDYGPGMGVVAISGYHTITANNSYGAMSGTSFSAPQVAGLASLVLARRPNLTVDQLYNIIEQNCTVLGGGFNEQTGYGLINFGKTLAAVEALNVSDITITPNTATVTKGYNQQFSATVTGENSPLQEVIWSVNNKTSVNTTISATGLLTVGADENATSLTVVAAAKFNNTKSVDSIVTVAGVVGIIAPPVNDIVYTPDLTLSNVGLPENWAWESPLQPLGNVGEKTFDAVYTDPGGSGTTTLPVTFNVLKAKLALPTLGTLNYDYDGSTKAPVVNRDTTLTSIVALGTTQSAVNAGDYSIIIGLNTSNYEWVNGTTDNVKLNWSISKVVLTVTANNINITAVQSLPSTFTATVKGFVNGETASVISGDFDFYTEAEQGVVGSYNIYPSIGGATATNYRFSFVAGILAIGIAIPTEGVDYLIPQPADRTFAIGLILADIDLSGTPLILEGIWAWKEPQTLISAGENQTAAAIFTPTDSANYSPVEVQVTYTINKAEVVLPTLDKETFTYDGTDKAISIILDDAYASVVTIKTIASAVNVGSYRIIVTLDDTFNTHWAGDYESPEIELVWKIIKAPPAVVPPATISEGRFGDSLSAWILTSGWQWKDNSLVPVLGINSFLITMNVNQLDENYDYSEVAGYDAATHTVTREISIFVAEGAPQDYPLWMQIAIIGLVVLILIIVLVLIALVITLHTLKKRDRKRWA